MTHTGTYRTRLGALVLTLAALGTAQMATTLPAVVEAQRSMADAPAKLILNITGYEGAEGQLLVALYNQAADFNDETTPLRDAKATVEAETTTVTFDDLPVGEYAFKLFHDVNGNGELDTDSLGIPSEPYFFSNDASDPFSAPEFDEAKFVLPSGKMSRNIDLS